MGYTGQSINMSADKGHQKLLPDGLEQLDNYRNYPKFLSYVLKNRPKLIGYQWSTLDFSTTLRWPFTFPAAHLARTLL